MTIIFLFGSRVIYPYLFGDPNKNINLIKASFIYIKKKPHKYRKKEASKMRHELFYKVKSFKYKHIIQDIIYNYYAL